MKRFAGKRIKLRHKVLIGIYLFSVIAYCLAWFLKPAVDFLHMTFSIRNPYVQTFTNNLNAKLCRKKRKH